MLNQTYIQLLKNYYCSEAIISDFWMEIENAYSYTNRYYHTLSHLENLLNQLSCIKSEIKSWETVLFSLFYHDIIYDSLRSDNEELSAELAEERMKVINVPSEIIRQCKIQIMATKVHAQSEESDVNYFTDADISILGKSWEEYSNYSKNVRMEYSIYSDSIFYEGRSRVLNHFLAMERIYKTDYFYTCFEKQAKLNIRKELDELNVLLNKQNLS